jgi:hypothetical protein
MAANRKFWKWFCVVALPFIGIVFALHNDIIDCINVWLNQAKPQILDAQNCIARIILNNEEIHFELLVNNAGSKDCSVTSIDLTWPDGLSADLGNWPSTSLPKTIPAGTTERIIMHGWGHKMKGQGFTPEGKLTLQPNQDSAEATVAVKFNTTQVIEKRITFVVERQ